MNKVGKHLYLYNNTSGIQGYKERIIPSINIVINNYNHII